MKTLSLAYLLLVFLTFSAFKFNPSNAKQTHPISDNNMLNTIDHLLDRIYQWRNEAQESQTFVSWLMVLAGVLCFIASSISSAGGIGGGGLFIPILTIVAGLDLKTASSLSAFMVTGGSIANVMCNLCRKSTKLGGKSLIDYDIALLSEPCMLLGVSVGVICNLVFPEWLITALFAVFLAWCTSKTCNCAMRFWRNESEEMRKKFGLAEKLEKGQPGNEIGTTEENKENEGSKSIEEPLLVPEVNSNERLPWLKLGVLFLVWFSFFSVYLLRGNKYGQSIIPMEPCGLEYWILSSVQVPLAVVFTAWIVFGKERLQDQQECPDLTKNSASHKLVFPLMAFLAGLLGGVFGIGGGMLISPFLLQVGVAPEVTAATCSFMVFFSSVMSALQYLLLGMEHIEIALILATISFIASLLGLLVVQKAIQKYGRTSLIVFSVGIVMSLSAVLMTSFGAIEVWKDYNSGKYMGFKLPC